MKPGLNRSSRTLIQPHSLLHVTILICLVAILSYLAARLGGALAIRPEMIWPVWPGCAFLVAMLLLTPKKVWLAVILAGLSGFILYDIQEVLPFRAIALLLLADAIEILVAALGVRYVFEGAPRLNSLKRLAKYSLFAVILGPVSVASIAAGAVANASWWVGFFTEALALLTLTPAILSWAEIALKPAKKPWTWYLEAASMCAGLAILSFFTFGASGGESRPAMLYSLIPFLLWAALRFGIAGISNSITLVAFLAILGAVHRRGPFTGNTPIHDVLSLQLFLLVLAASFMVLAAVVEERTAAKAAVAESEERLRLAVQAGRMFAYSWDVASDEIERSGEAAEILGVQQESVRTGATISSMVHPDDKKRLQAAVEDLSPERPTLQITYRVIRPDGEVVWLERNSQAYFDSNGNLVRLVGMVADVTERKRAEEVLADMTRKLIEAQEQERSRIGRELHDDINQQLAMLALEVQQIVENPPLIETRGRILRKHLDDISSDVQALSHDLHSSKLEYLGVVPGIRSWCKEFAGRQKLEIDFRSDVSSPVPPAVGLCFFRVLQEAIHNAVSHSGVRRVEVQLWKDAGEIHLDINDQGRGFDVEQAMHGTGLGLTSMRERVRLVNGNILIHSQPNRGTSIRVRAPLEPEHHSRSEAV